jgi:hypothetical protein
MAQFPEQHFASAVNDCWQNGENEHENNCADQDRILRRVGGGLAEKPYPNKQAEKSRLDNLDGELIHARFDLR